VEKEYSHLARKEDTQKNLDDYEEWILRSKGQVLHGDKVRCFMATSSPAVVEE
jgi:hypothetical protein